MATYVNDLRLTELATGEGSGTWGTTTNTSLELIGEALGYATQQAFGSDADATTTVADGASDPARAMYYKITSAASLTATRTLTIAPNTISRVMFIENATTGSQSIAISQGSGASVTILSGKTAVVYLDGAGATAAVVDAMAGVDPGVTDTLTEVLVAGNTSGGTNIELSTTDKVQFRDAAIYLNSSVDGQLDIVADTEIQIAATTIDVNGTLAFDSLKGTGATTVTNILDEDNMASDSATAIATQQSIKAYVDSQVGSFDTLAEVLAQGNTTGSTDIAVDSAQKVQFRDAAIYINSSVDGQLDIVADTEIQIAATTIDIDGAINASGEIIAASLDISGDIDVDGVTNLDVVDIDGALTGTTATFVGANTLTLRNDTGTDADEPKLTFDNDTFAGANYGNIRTGNGGLQLILESPSTSTFQNRQRILFNSGGSDELSFDLSTDNGSSFTNYFKLDGGNAIFNETGADKDFRVESSGNANMLFVDGGESAVGIGTATQYDGTALVSPLTISSLSGGNVLETFRGSASLFQLTMSTTGISSWNTSGSAAAHSFRTGTTVGTTSIKMYLGATGGLTMTPEAGGHTVFNEDGIDANFRVETSGNENMLFVDGGGNAVGIGTATPTGTLHVDKDIASGANYGIIQNDGAANTNTIAGWVIRDGSSIMSGIRRRRDGGTSPTEIGNFSSDEAVFFLQNNESCLQLNGDGSIVFNEDSLDKDFRVESDTNANGFKLDASTSTVAVNKNPSSVVALSVNANLTNSSTYAFEACNATSNTKFIVRSDGFGGFYKTGNGPGFIHDTDGAITITPDAGGDFVFNEDGVDADFRVESDNNASMLTVDASADLVTISGGSKVTDEVLRVNGAQVVGSDAAGVYTVGLNEIFAASAAKYLRIQQDGSLFGGLTITATGDYSNVNAIGCFQKIYSIGANNSNTTLFSPGNVTVADLGETSGQFSMGTPTKPNATTIYIPLENLNASYILDMSITVEFRGRIGGISAVDILDQ
jgi:cytoskeletal protein CcmA (bactofilin family)